MFFSLQTSHLKRGVGLSTIGKAAKGCYAISKTTQSTQSNRNEHTYQKILEHVYSGAHKYIRGIGITDITTDDMHLEIKRWPLWKNGMGQLIAYNTEVPKDKKVLCLFGEYGTERKAKAIQTLVKNDIRVLEIHESASQVQVYDPIDGTVLFRVLAP